jgi:hypothetical protein
MKKARVAARPIGGTEKKKPNRKITTSAARAIILRRLSLRRELTGEVESFGDTDNARSSVASWFSGIMDCARGASSCDIQILYSELPL